MSAAMNTHERYICDEVRQKSICDSPGHCIERFEFILRPCDADGAIDIDRYNETRSEMLELDTWYRPEDYVASELLRRLREGGVTILNAPELQRALCYRNFFNDYMPAPTGRAFRTVKAGGKEAQP